jgi:hypothetical protein
MNLNLKNTNMKKLTNKRSFVCDCGCEVTHYIGQLYMKKGFGYQIQNLSNNHGVITPREEGVYRGEIILDLPNASSSYFVENELEKTEITNGLFVAVAEDENSKLYLVYAMNERKEVNPRMNEPQKLYLTPLKNYADYITAGGTIIGISIAA